MKVIVVIGSLACELLWLVSLLISIYFPDKRIWPPPHRNSWQFWWTWPLSNVPFVGGMIVGAWDWNSFLLDHWSRYAVGSLLSVGGFLLTMWSVRTLSVVASLGLKDRLVVSGPYRWSRNPQYVGCILMLVGIVVMTNSTWAMPICGLGILWFTLAPLAEEPWLREQYGTDYEEYVRRTPRFLGKRSFGMRRL